jgi:thiol-disulfide isomerase/thioredoxin
MKKLRSNIIIFLLTVIFFWPGITFAKAEAVLVVKKNNGEIFDLSKNHNKVTIITFWASWCGNCYAEMKRLETIYQKYPREKLEILAVDVDEIEDNKEDAARMIKKFSYPMAYLSEAKANNLKYNGVPTTYIVSKGKGVTDPESLENAVTKAMEDFK